MQSKYHQFISICGSPYSIQGNEAITSAHSALEALQLVLPDSVSHTQPWVPSSPEQVEAIALHQQRNYNQLLDELEHCAISHQFEVEKMGLPRTGE